MKTVYWMLRKITEENYMISTSKKNKNKETTNRVLPKLMVATCELKSSFHAANKILGILGYPKECSHYIKVGVLLGDIHKDI